MAEIDLDFEFSPEILTTVPYNFMVPNYLNVVLTERHQEEVEGVPEFLNCQID